MTLLFVAVAWVAGVLLGARYEPTVAAIALLVLASLLLAGLLRSVGRPVFPAVLLLAVVLGIARVGAWDQRPDGQLAHYHGPGSVLLEGSVVDDPDVSGRATRFRFKVASIDTGRGLEAVAGDVLVTTRRINELSLVREPPFIRYGDELVLTGVLQRPPALEEFDYPAYLARQGIGSVLLFPEMSLVEAGGGLTPYRWLYAARRRMADSLVAVVPEPQSSLGQALLLGLRQDLPDELVEKFRATGTSHVLAISGLHVGVLLGLSLSASALAFGRRRQAYLLVPLALMWLYALMAGLPPSAARAAIMGSVYLAAIALGRPRSALPALGVAAALMVGLNPSVLWDVSFQLSFAAMAGIALFAQPISEWLNGRLSALPGNRWQSHAAFNFAIYALAMGAAATLATLPIIAFHFQRVSLVGLPVSLMVLPALPVLIVSNAVVAVVGTLSELAATPLGWIVWVLGAYVTGIVGLAALVPGASFETSAPAPTMVWAYFGLLAAGYYNRPLRAAVRPLATRLRAFPRPGLPSSKPVQWWVLAPAIAAAVVVWVVALSIPDGKLRVTFADVGQGDSAMITTPSGKQVLVDGGPDPALAANLLGRTLPFWDRTIELVILTHPHSDHVTGLIEALRRYGVTRILERSLDYDSLPHAEWRDTVAQEGATLIQASQGQVVDLGDGARLEILWPRERLLTGTDSDVDNASIVLRLVYGEVSFLLTGDVFEQAERSLLADGADIGSTVLKVAHHGSRSSSGGGFLDRVAPAVAVISAGADNRFGHPHAETVQALESRLAPGMVLATKDVGAVAFVTDGKRLTMKTER